ncbi:Holliday junction branch migration protein RuvA [Irregularibacter muris]|uniref:Holliday junction branch migration complex subunit RuvA n=1 Tax=Irregularibacter muris TaxID=1796619 RepID=A0AAE3KZ68_9FIRM|nr:Holliday junction branch migration protein RuvA [Irregularibacter muris]MCR1898216.1 Holliday junction branch migration protein RuvA [Irregularibacter muris]
MFEFIKGNLEEVLADGIVVEIQGIAYRIYTSQLLLNELPPIGSTIKIYLHMNVREDDISLYGFLSKDERNMYRSLNSVSGVGPKAAMGILSIYNANEIIWAIVGEDTKTLTKAPGIGKKTAQRIILELKDKLKVEDIKVTENTNTSSENPEVKEEAIEALSALGYQSSQIFRIINDVYREGMSIEVLIKETLKCFASRT